MPTCSCGRFSCVPLAVVTLSWFGVSAGQCYAQDKPQTAEEHDVVPAERGGPSATEHIPPAAHWELSPEEDELLDEVLEGWEAKSGAVRTLKANFTKREYNNELLDKSHDPNKPTRELTGEIRYQKPDKAVYKEDGDEGEWWICDGNALHEFRRSERKVIERRLPEGVQGKAIFDRFLPFFFGVEAADLKVRYFIRVNKKNEIASHIWLEIYPRTEEDAVNFAAAEVILDEKTMLPYAIQLNDNNQTSSVSFVFENARIDSVLGNVFDLIKVSTPFGWKRDIVDLGLPVQGMIARETPGESAPNDVVPAVVETTGDVGPTPLNSTAKDNVPPAASLELTPEEEKLLDQVLTKWEAKRGATRTLAAEFTKRVSNGTLEFRGEIRDRKPENSVYQEAGELRERWICDVDMPLVFGVQPAELKSRYFARVVQAGATAGQIWLDVFPRTAEDARQFDALEIILDEPTMLVSSIRINRDNFTSSTSYVFENTRTGAATIGLADGITASAPPDCVSNRRRAWAPSTQTTGHGKRLITARRTRFFRNSSRHAPIGHRGFGRTRIARALTRFGR